MKAVGIIVFVLILALVAMSVWQRGRGSIAEAPMPPVSNSIARGPVAPDIISDTWFNSPMLAPADLRGKVVVVEFWTFG